MIIARRSGRSLANIPIPPLVLGAVLDLEDGAGAVPTRRLTTADASGADAKKIPSDKIPMTIEEIRLIYTNSI